MSAVAGGPAGSTGREGATVRPILDVDGVGKRFGRTTVLKSASLHARSGEVCALMGRNGAGKSTLLRIAAGLMRADHGRMLYRGVFRPRPSLPRLAREGLTYIAQDSALTGIGSVRSHLRAVVRAFPSEEGRGPQRMGNRTPRCEERCAHAIETMALPSILDHHRSELSGGERQRASLALALIAEPLCLLVDEPFAGITPKDTELISRGLRLLRDSGCAVVVTGHRVHDLFEVADRVIWVTAGTTHWLGTPGEAAAHAQFRREYLGPRGAPEGAR